MILDKIQKENDIKNLTEEELAALPGEIRQFLIEHVAVTGGHLSANLGVVELTMALHLTFTLPQDQIIWDVGHQSYTHKLLTGRRDGFESLRQYGGMSGFPKGEESPCDAFDTGHSSDSLCAALGMAHARDLLGEDYHVIAVIGDGAMTGGLAYEGLNNASSLSSNLIIVLNDNHMAISESVGGVSRFLSSLRTAQAYRGLKENVTDTLERIPHGDRLVRGIKNAKSSVKQLFVPGMFFEEMGILYLGPVDGSNLGDMRRVLEEASRVNGPVLVHVLTKKGAGYPPAEKNPARFHGVEGFDPATGETLPKKEKAHYTDVFSSFICRAAQENSSVVAVTAAMADGTGLTRFSRRFPERFFDVGIAEEGAVSFAAGMAKRGLKPVVAVYSSFLQRAYDQIMLDVCMQNLPVVFAVDRAGLSGGDGQTHQGLFDLSYLSSIPNLTVMAPKNKWELADMLRFALSLGRPAAVRYPKGEAYAGCEKMRTPIVLGKSETLHEGRIVALLAIGSMVQTALQTQEMLRSYGIDATVVNARFAAPLDREAVRGLTKEHVLLVTMEENVKSGGFGEHVASFAAEEHLALRIASVCAPDQFIAHGSVSEMMAVLHMDAASVLDLVLLELKKMH